MNNLVFEDLQIKLPELRASLGGQEIKPSLCEMRLLMILMSDPYGVFTHDELITRLDLTSYQGLQQTIMKLRMKLENRYVINEPRVGYSLAARRN